MGGIKTFFFGDGVQLLPFQQKEGKIWKSEIFNTVLCYSLQNPVRQQGVCFIDIHNKVRNYESDESVVSFLNERSFHKSQVPLSCLRLYMTRQSYTRTQFPIVPAFTDAIHKAQSTTIDCVGIHLDSMLSHG
ncbi:hypothetical protein G6F61_010518 [Rhizopus arrhizus]|nr:hypothetical protein G6F61_010518 [Rhizopus arrhizus]